MVLLGACAPAPQWRGLVKIGLILPFHGRSPAAALDAHVAVRDRLITRNRAGGLDGWRLELVSLDDQGDPEVADRRVEELSVDPDMVALLGASGGTEEAAATSNGLAFHPIASAGAATATVDELLSEVSRGLAAGSTPRNGLRARLLGS